MNKLQATIAIFVIAGFLSSLFAQQDDTLYIRRHTNGEIAFARFKIVPNSDRKMSNDTAFLRAILKVNPNNEFRLKSTKTDRLGIVHKRFQQYYKGLEVANHQYLLHGKDDDIEVMNGYFENIALETIVPVINEQPLLKALEYVDAII
ncbi:MAG: hypothetical protein FWC41_10120 [Firmicutes bacterium]|nr:hypothetical protein [Bacillota bacterium]